MNGFRRSIVGAALLAGVAITGFGVISATPDVHPKTTKVTGLPRGRGESTVGAGVIGSPDPDGVDEQVVGARDVSNLDIDLDKAEAAVAATGVDVVMSWFSGDNAASVVVMAVDGDVPDDDLDAAVAQVTEHHDRFRFVRSRYGTAELEHFVEEAQAVWASHDVTWGGPRSRWVLDTMLEPGRYARQDAQPAVWILVDPAREAELTEALLDVIPADAMVIDADAQPVDYR